MDAANGTNDPLLLMFTIEKYVYPRVIVYVRVLKFEDSLQLKGA